MKKAVQLLLLLTIIYFNAGAQQRLFDQKVKLKTCNITINANPFIATTMVEMEFYNSRDEEVEALQQFELKKGQVITAFQLDLNGKYRDGSIEERWKATRAYSSIVGKRIDPAILQMDWQNRYSLRIYPIPAKSSRKITFTITQLMEADSNRLTYFLPLAFTDTTEKVHIKALINPYESGCKPYANNGLLQNEIFADKEQQFLLSLQKENCVLNKPVSFSLQQFTSQPAYCAGNNSGQNNFIIRVLPNVAKTYTPNPQTLHIFWDASFSAKDRNISKEIDFIEAYLKSSAVKKVYVTLFNHAVKEEKMFTLPAHSIYNIRSYLSNCSYEGATLLANLDFSRTKAEMIFLFSDGVNSYGRQLPQPGTVPVNCVTSFKNPDYQNLVKISTGSGGSVINLFNTTTASGIKAITVAENFLTAAKGETIQFNNRFPVKLEKDIFLTGTATKAGPFTMVYGNNNIINKTENAFFTMPVNCADDIAVKLKMLRAYDSVVYGPNLYNKWQDMIVFGLTEKVITPQTAYLVLERIEDYIKYNIAPPAELEEKCAEMNYVYNSGYKIQALKNTTAQDILQDVTAEYNKRIQWWDKTAALINLNETTAADFTETVTGENQNVPAQNTGIQNWKGNTAVAGGELKEVVVTSAFGIKRAARSVSANMQTVSAEELTVIRQTNVSNALAGKVAGIQVRSQSYVKLGAASTMVRLRGENSLSAGSGVIYVVNGNIMDNSNDINVDDINDITVLQAPAAAALFGPDGANGAIVINTKRAVRSYPYQQRIWTNYKLSDMEDVDYLVEIRNTDVTDAWQKYEQLQKSYGDETAFYYDMADYFFEIKKPYEAKKILLTAIELCHGNKPCLKLAAYTLEKWKQFDAAIELYHQLLITDENNLLVKRDMALAYLQNKNYQQAVNTYYNIITAADNENQYLQLKENALAEMNAVIALDIPLLDISFIDKRLIKILPADLRITVEANNNSLNSLQVIEPGGASCNFANPLTVNGGRLKTSAEYLPANNCSEYVLKNAQKGKYRVKINAYGYYNNSMPQCLRIVTFKNFHKTNMSIQIESVSIDNQYGVVEIVEILL